MPDYRELYFSLSREVSRTIERLKEIQREMEEKYLLELEKEEELGKSSKIIALKTDRD